MATGTDRMMGLMAGHHKHIGTIGAIELRAEVGAGLEVLREDITQLIIMRSLTAEAMRTTDIQVISLLSKTTLTDGSISKQTLVQFVAKQLQNR